MADFNDDIDLAMDCCLDYYGDQVIFKPVSGGSYKVTGIFDNAVSMIDTSGEIPIETTKPVLSVKLSDFDKLGIDRPAQEDQFVIKGNLYTITSQPDDGWSEGRIVLFHEGEL